MTGRSPTPSETIALGVPDNGDTIRTRRSGTPQVRATTRNRRVR
jgi:hypothetical protein